MVRKRGGRPNKAALLEREQRKAEAAEQEQERAVIEAAIGAGEDVSDVVYPAHASLLSPVTRFLIERLGMTGEWSDEVIHDALLDLLCTDFARSAKSRRQIVGMLRRKTPEQKRASKARAFLLWVEQAKDYLRERGMTGEEAEQEIAKTLGCKVESLHVTLTRARKRGK
jgi:hypothetical protein